MTARIRVDGRELSIRSQVGIGLDRPADDGGSAGGVVYEVAGGELKLLDRPIAFTGCIVAGGRFLHRRELVFDRGRLVVDPVEQRRVTNLHVGALSLMDGAGEVSITS